MTPEIKRLRAETDERVAGLGRVSLLHGRDLEARLAAERAAWEALLRDIIHAAGAVVQEARHHELMPWFKAKLDELERVTTIGGQP